MGGVDALKVTYTDSTTLDLKIEYGYIPEHKLTHYAIGSLFDNSSIKIMKDNSISTLSMIHGTDYQISGANNN